ncbi:MAG: hypothetical protein IPP28_02450 [Xanthomonadales bacterium]|nr:hypothetical protein [Xanthomonadales bacterium]
MFRSVDGGGTWAAADQGIVADTIYGLPLMLDAEQPATLYLRFKVADLSQRRCGSTWAILPESLPSDVHPTAFAEQGRHRLRAAARHGAPAAGGRGPMLFKSTNCGLDFFQIGTGLPADRAVTSIAFDPANPLRVFVGLVDGGVGNQPLCQHRRRR